LGSALLNWLASATPSPCATASSVAGDSRELAIGTPASCAITSRGVHSANARRAFVGANAPCGAKISCSMPADGDSARS